MIIVEGAVYERGKRLLVKDESVQDILFLVFQNLSLGLFM